MSTLAKEIAAISQLEYLYGLSFSDIIHQWENLKMPSVPFGSDVVTNHFTNPDNTHRITISLSNYYRSSTLRMEGGQRSLVFNDEDSSLTKIYWKLEDDWVIKVYSELNHRKFTFYIHFVDTYAKGAGFWELFDLSSSTQKEFLIAQVLPYL